MWLLNNVLTPQRCGAFVLTILVARQSKNPYTIKKSVGFVPLVPWKVGKALCIPYSYTIRGIIFVLQVAFDRGTPKNSTLFAENSQLGALGSTTAVCIDIDSSMIQDTSICCCFVYRTQHPTQHGMKRHMYQSEYGTVHAMYTRVSI